jgi:hypothetical protein
MMSSGSRRIGIFLDTIWYGCSAPETLMVVLALLAVTVVVAGVFPQQPPGLQDAAAERWLASAAGGYPGVGAFLRQIGVFDVLAGLWLRVLLAAVALIIALRLAVQADALAAMLRVRREASTPEESVTDHPQSATGIPQAASHNPQSTVPSVTGPLLAYAGALVLLVGLLLNGLAGWRATDITLAPGASTALGHAGAPKLSLLELTGSEANPVASIGLAEGANAPPADAGQISFGVPIRRAGLWIALQSAGPALQAKASDGRARPLLLQSLEPGLRQGEVSEEIHLLFRQMQSEQEFALPSANISFRVVSYPSLPEKGIETPVFLVEAYQGDDPAPVLSSLVMDEASLALNGVTVDLVRDRYAIVDATYLPGLVPLLAGGVAILAGLILSLWSWPRRKAGEELVPAESPEAGRDQAGSEPAHAS